ncbi:prolyl aminopeptidase [Luteococcus peritonei]|uniref:Proline iminopeptidase n=1 Tax=Luteococcus peritonei TaxID=88874 RepID=A0ABW4RW03_9ACTN
MVDGAAITPRRTLYPPVEPYRSFMLDVGEGNRLHVEECGNPQGKPAVFLHGGPGGGGGIDRRRFFDPERYRIIVFDQRNCGASTPSAADGADLSANTTWHLVDDIERLREHLGIERWLVFGGSWGSTLALAYAESHPGRVTELVLRGIFTLRRSELDWYYNEGASHIAPQWWESYLEPLREAGVDPSADKIAAYHDLLFGDDPELAQRAGNAWTHWEAATSNLLFDEPALHDTPEHALTFARIENHYFVNAGFLREGQLIDEVDRVRHIPCVMVQGRYDLPCPARTAWDLSQAWPEAELRVVLAGHSAFEPNITAELVEATDRFARDWQPNA